MRRWMVGVAVMAWALAACGGGGDADEDAVEAESTSTAAEAPEEASEEVTTTVESSPPVDRSGRRETDTATVELEVDGEVTEIADVTCRAIGPTNRMKWIVTGGDDPSLFLDANHLAELPAEETTELADARQLDLFVGDDDYLLAEDSSLVETSGTLTVAVTDAGASATVEIEGEADDGTAISATVECTDMTARDDFGEPLEEEPDQAGPGPEEEETGNQECTYLATDAVASALGVDVEVSSAGERACVFRSTDDSDLSLELTRIDILIDPEQYADEARDLCDAGTVVDIDAGDQAYACVDFGPSGSYYQGDVLISLGSSFLDDEDEQLIFDAIVELLPEITV